MRTLWLPDFMKRCRPPESGPSHPRARNFLINSLCDVCFGSAIQPEALPLVEKARQINIVNERDIPIAVNELYEDPLTQHFV